MWEVWGKFLQFTRSILRLFFFRVMPIISQTTLISRMTALRDNLVKLPRRLGVPQYNDITIVSDTPIIIQNAVVTKVKPFDVIRLGEGLSVGSDDLWASVSRKYSLAELNGTHVSHWLISGVEEVPTLYRVAFIDDRELLVYKVLLNRYYEGR